MYISDYSTFTLMLIAVAVIAIIFLAKAIYIVP